MTRLAVRGWWRASALVVPGSLALATATTALAFWGASGSGHGAGAAAVMPTGSTPVAYVSGTSVVVSWAAVTLSSGSAVSGYTVQRKNAATGTVQTIGANCSGTVSATTCTEQNVPAGNWTYSDTPVAANWTGTQSPASSAVAVG